MLLGAIAPLVAGQAAQANEPVTIQFQGMVGDEMFTCGSSYSGLGTSSATVTPTDFRFYISDVALIDESGSVVPVMLEQDGVWQHESVALLDFEDQTGDCSNGTPETRTAVVGTVPPGNYTGVTFTLGVPFSLNHDDMTLAPSPLNVSSMWWNWAGGYKFVRIDLENEVMSTSLPTSVGPQVRSLSSTEIAAGHGQEHGTHGDGHHAGGQGHTMAQGFLIHLGSTGCQIEGDSLQPTLCNQPNRSRFMFTGFDPSQNVIVADVEALVSENDLTQNEADTPLGCMSSPEDADCRGILNNFGLPHAERPSSGQTFFRME